MGIWRRGNQMSLDTAQEVVRASPPVVATGLTLFGVSLSDWLIILTIIYTVAQLHFLLRDKSPVYRGVYKVIKNFFLRRKNDSGS